MLNFGQNAIFSTSLVAVMLCASSQITAGRYHGQKTIQCGFLLWSVHENYEKL